MANRIYRGPLNKPFTSRNLPVAGAYLPGILVITSGAALTMAVAADMTKRLLVLANVDFAAQDVNTAYTNGDTGIAIELNPNDQVQCRFAAGTYAYGAALTVGALGRVIAAATGDTIIGYYDQTGATLAAGDLGDVIIANGTISA
jgi:acyl CoA:acetate/3-ketoacid CoA transferase alpha subunit